MQHGSNACPIGYTMDYSGFLFANRYHSSRSLGTHSRSQFVCIDFSPQGYQNGRGNSDDNYGQLYPVEIQCSGIPCPPYRNYREVTCAQCSKNITYCPGYMFNGICFMSCPPGTYVDSLKTCQPCHQLCNQSKGCTGPRQDECEDCAFATILYHGLKRCVKTCPDGFTRTSNNSCIFSTLGKCNVCLMNCCFICRGCVAHVRVTIGFLSFLCAVGVDCEGVQHGGKQWDRCGMCGGKGESCDQTAVYTRWGHSSCPSQSRFLFSGFAAR